MILSPVKEWRIIGKESSSVRSILIGFVIPMALIPAVASFVGFGFIGIQGLRARVRGLYWGSAMAMDSFITSLAIFWLGTYIVDGLAPWFGTKRDPGRSAQLVAYSYAPAWIAGIFYLLPSLQGFTGLGLYGVYIFYLGVALLKPTTGEQRIAYTIISAILIIVVRFLVGLLIVNIIYSIWGDPFLPFSSGLF